MFKSVIPTVEQIRLINASRERFDAFCTQALAFFGDDESPETLKKLSAFLDAMEQAKDQLGRALADARGPGSI